LSVSVTYRLPLPAQPQKLYLKLTDTRTREERACTSERLLPHANSAALAPALPEPTGTRQL